MMSFLKFLFAIIFAILFINVKCIDYNPATSVVSKQLDESIQKFGIRLVQQLFSNYSGNIIISPLAIQTVLTIMYNGAQGITEDIMSQSLNFDGIAPSTNALATAFSKLVTPILISPDVQMSTAVYVSSVYPTYFVWKYFAEQKFLSDCKAVNFSNPVKAAEIMNNYAANITFGKIPNLIKPKWLNSNTSVVLVNALYMNGPWKYPFSRINDRQTFRNDLKRCVKAKSTVEMMSVKAPLKYLEHPGLHAKIVQLPYANSNLTLTIFYPNACGSLKRLIKDLHTTFDFMTLKSLFTVKTVELSIPRFSIDFQMDNIDPALSAIGLGNIFSPSQADFYGILELLTDSTGTQSVENKSPNLYIDRVVQKAIINVTHFGSAHETKKLPHITSQQPFGSLPTTKLQFSMVEQLTMTRSFVFIVQNNNDLVFIGRFISPDAIERAQDSDSSSSSSTGGTTSNGNDYYEYSGTTSSKKKKPLHFEFKSSSYKTPSFQLKPLSSHSRFNFF